MSKETNRERKGFLDKAWDFFEKIDFLGISVIFSKKSQAPPNWPPPGSPRDRNDELIEREVMLRQQLISFQDALRRIQAEIREQDTLVQRGRDGGDRYTEVTGQELTGALEVTGKSANQVFFSASNEYISCVGVRMEIRNHVDFPAHLERLISSLEASSEEPVAGTEVNLGVQIINKALVGLLRGELAFYRQRGVGQPALPFLIWLMNGFPPLPSMKVDWATLMRSGEHEELKQLFEVERTEARCEHCFCRVHLGERVRWVQIVTYENIFIREEESWLTLALKRRSECKDDVYTTYHPDPEFVNGRERTVVTCRYRWLWDEDRLEIKVE